MEQITAIPRKMKGVDFSAAGPENDNHAKAWREAMDWARVELDYATLKQYFQSWAKINRDLEEQAHWAALPTHHYATLGRIAFVLQHGAVMPEDVQPWFDAKLLELLQIKVTVDDEDEPQRKLSTVQKRNLDYVMLYSKMEAIWRKHLGSPAEIEEAIKKLLDRAQPNQQMLKRLYDHFKESFADALRDKDNELVAETIEPIVTVVNVLATSTGNARAVADSRGASRKSVKQASKAKFKTVDLNTDMASINPAMIPGSSKALVYNSKSRKVYLYVANNGGLGIKGTKVIGYDEALSFAKTLRNPKQTLGTLRDAATAKRVDVVMGDYIKGKKHPVNGRLNKDTLVIKVFK
jgi:hypothetical protein